MEEDEHKERVLKLIDRIKLFDTRNAVLREKLKSKTMRPKQRELLTAELEKIPKISLPFAGKSVSAKADTSFVARLRFTQMKLNEPKESLINIRKKQA